MAPWRRNVEVKAIDPSPARSLPICHELDAEDRGLLRQRDTYFNVPHGRLKLREEGERAWLIPYDRSDAGEARLSHRLVGPLARECRLARLKDGQGSSGREDVAFARL